MTYPFSWHRKLFVLFALSLTFASTVITSAWADVDFAGGNGSGPIKASHSNLCLGLSSGSTAAGAQIIQETCNGSAAQFWQAKPFGSGFTVVNLATGQCLDSQISNTAGGAVIQWPCNGSGQQTWSVKARGGGIGLVSAYSGQCLDVFGGFKDSGTKIIQWGCHSDANQTFVPVALATGDGSALAESSGRSPISFANRTGAGPIKVAHSGLCLTVPGGSTTGGTQLVQEPCNGSIAQTWQVNRFGDGFNVVNRATGLCIDSQISKVAGGAIIQWACNGMAQQTWSAMAQGDGFSLTAAYSGQCLDVFGGDKESGTRLIQWNCTGNTNQTFMAGSATSDGGSLAGDNQGGGGGSNPAGSAQIGGNGGSISPSASPPAATGLIVARHSAMCVANPNAQMAAGTGLVQWTCEPKATHMDWRFVPVGNGYEIQNVKSGLCLTVSGGATANGAGTSQQACNRSAGSLWTFRKVGSFFELVAAHSGRCLNIFDSSRTDNAAVIQWDCTAQDNALFSLVPPAAPSFWTAPTSLGIVPAAATMLPSGKVMMWAAEAKYYFYNGNGTWFTVYDPKTGSSEDTYIANTEHDMFCPGTNLLADGRLVVAGGITSGATSIYNPDTNQWSSGPKLNISRGYNSSVTLSTGEAMTYGGSWSGGPGGKNAEVWSPETGNWRVLSNVLGNAGAESGNNIYRNDNHFWMFAVSNGSVFRAGPSREMHWIGTQGNGTLTSAGRRSDDAHSMNGTATMFDVNRIFKAGGAPSYENDPANGLTYTIDISGGPGTTPVVKAAPPLAFARAFHNSVVLPSGDVVVVGGQTMPVPFTDTTAIYHPEMWSPTKNTMVRLAPIDVPRTYHSVALLLTDGRVLSAGGGLCGNGCSQNHPDLQILTPPYLYAADGSLASRPVIVSAPAKAFLGRPITTVTDRAVGSFALVRLGSNTHTVDNDQRRVPLTISWSRGTLYSLALPADPGIVTPGNWMLFALDANGVPSVAKVIRIR